MPSDSVHVRRSGTELEQLVLLSAALVLGLVGLVVHVLWIASIVIMAVALGLTAAALRRSPGRGVVQEVVAEVKGVAEEISNSSGEARGASHSN